jgi:N-formylglutamate amidohydrolase
VPGDAPLILLVPHGGALRPESMDDRGLGVRLADSRTLELARDLVREFEVQNGQRPHLILCHLHRSKLDANRDAGEAAQGDEQALLAWRAWHGFIEEAKRAVVEAHGAGLLVDLHGQSHPERWIEWGFALDAEQLARQDSALALNGPGQEASSVDALARRKGGDRAELLRGPHSLGALCQAAGYRSVPSPAHPHPAGGRYFSGGYNTRRHGSSVGGRIDAVQLEVPRHLRVEPKRRRKLARDLARTLGTFLAHWYDFEARSPASEGGQDPAP